MEATQHEGEERYIRIAITKNTKGYNYETTVSYRWGSNPQAPEVLETLNREADKLARLEMARREDLDNWKADAEANLEGIS